MRPALIPAALAIALLAGCNNYNLRYKAVPQPANRHFFADFTTLQNAVGIYVDTDGRRLEEIFIRKPNGDIVRPARIDYPGFGRSASIGPGVGIGPIGVGVGFPVGPKRAEGLTTATFPADTLGPPPWEVHVKIQGSPEATIPAVGGPPTAK